MFLLCAVLVMRIFGGLIKLAGGGGGGGGQSLHFQTIAVVTRVSLNK